MSTLKLEYEILVSGIYPVERTFKKCGFELVQKAFDDKVLTQLSEKGAIYLSPFMGYCCYPDSGGKPVYLTFRKVEDIEIDYGNNKEYDVATTNRNLKVLNLFDAVETLEKTMVLEVNNDIKFPITVIKAYDSNGKFVTLLADFKKLNVPSLLSNDQVHALERMKRQNNRLSSGISYEGINELAGKNNYFKNALAMYHSSFSVSDYKVGFVLLITALEALVSLSTYAKVEQCETCNQKLYTIRRSVSENVGAILMDQDGAICRRMKKLYDKRSKFLHDGIQDISAQEEQEIQEYVRKVLLMYWCVSMRKDTYVHKDIMSEVNGNAYKEDVLYQNFLTGLDNTTFEEKRSKMLKDIFLHILCPDEPTNAETSTEQL